MMHQKNQQYDQTIIEDPFLQKGGKIVYQGDHKFTICIQQKPQLLQKLPNQQILTVKVVVIEQHDTPKNITIQLTSDSDLYFNFVFICNDWEFKRVRQKQNFFIQFRQYPTVIIKNLEKLLKSDKYSAFFTIFSQTQGRMDVIRHSQFKDDTILTFDFNKESEQQIRESIQFRYDQIRHQYLINSKCYEDIAETVKSKNPSLMMQINKSLKKR